MSNKKTRAVKEGKYNDASGPFPTNLVKAKGTMKPHFMPKPKKMIRSG